MGAILKEIWQAEIENNVFPAFNKLKLIAKDDSAYINAGVVHIPNAGAIGTIQKNPTFPLSVVERTDTDVTYNIDKYSFPPTRVGSLEKLQSNDYLRESVIEDITSSLPNRAIAEIVISWLPDASNKVVTSGSDVAAHAPSATGNRKALTNADILAAKNKMNQMGFYDNLGLAVDYAMFYQLANTLSVQAGRDFSYVYDAINGEMQKIHGITIIVLPTVVYLASNDTKRAYGATGAAADNAAALLVNKNAVSLAIGGVELFLEEKSAAYQGDLISGGLLAGGKYRRTDKKGVVPIIQAPTS